MKLNSVIYLLSRWTTEPFLIAKMAPLLEVFNLMVISEMNPIKNIDYITVILSLIDNIKNSITNNDWIMLGQYKLIYLILLSKAAHYIYLQMADLTMVESIIHFDLFRWVKLDKSVFLFTIVYMLISVYFIHIIYFTSKNAYFVKSRNSIFFNPSEVNYYWPYKYKNRGPCGLYLRRFSLLVLKLLQIFVVPYGKTILNFQITLVNLS